MNRIGVLALQGAFIEHIKVLKTLGAEAVPVRLPDQLEGLDGLIIPGGESTTIGKLLHRWDFLPDLKRKIRNGFPVFGTCAGMILLAEKAVGLNGYSMGLMNIKVKRNAFGRQLDSFEADLIMPALGEPSFHAVFIRAPLIEVVGKEVEVLARLEDGTIVAAKERNMLVAAFHPELTSDDRLHKYFLGMVKNEKDHHR